MPFAIPVRHCIVLFEMARSFRQSPVRAVADGAECSSGSSISTMLRGKQPHGQLVHGQRNAPTLQTHGPRGAGGHGETLRWTTRQQVRQFAITHPGVISCWLQARGADGGHRPTRFGFFSRARQTRQLRVRRPQRIFQEMTTVAVFACRLPSCLATIY